MLSHDLELLCQWRWGKVSKPQCSMTGAERVQAKLRHDKLVVLLNFVASYNVLVICVTMILKERFVF